MGGSEVKWSELGDDWDDYFQTYCSCKNLENRKW